VINNCALYIYIERETRIHKCAYQALKMGDTWKVNSCCLVMFGAELKGKVVLDANNQS
jgi:hypothetical protein